MTNKKHFFLLMVAVVSVIIVVADFIILLFFGLSYSSLIIRLGLPGLVFVVINTLVVGRGARYFAPGYFQNIDEGELAEHYKAIGGTPLKMLIMNIVIHFLFLGSVFLPKNYLDIDPAIKGSLFLATQSLGMLIGTFIYVIIDGLVSTALLSNKLTKYPRNFREKRQSVKVFLIPLIMSLVTLLFTFSVVMLAVIRAGGTVGKINNIFMYSLLFIYFLIITGMAFGIRKNTLILYSSIVEQMENLSSDRKDLTKRISICSVDELGTVAGMVNTFCEHMSRGIQDIKSGQNDLSKVGNRLEGNASDMADSIAHISEASEKVLAKTNGQKESINTSSAAVQQIASNIASLEKTISAQVSSMSQASAAVEEMIGNISSIGNVTEKMTSQFKTVEVAAEEGSTIQKESSVRIGEIVQQSNALQEANRIIATIAAQTNLLAMNAAIEAAHAGDAGRGFSVVADEIRKLAETSSKESQKINAELKQIIKTIQQIVNDSEISSKAFSEVSRRIGETEKLVIEVDSAIQEQKTGAGQVMESLRAMNDAASQVSEGSREMGKGNEAMLREISELQGSAVEISTSMEEMSGNIKTINTGAREVSDLAATTRSSIQKISEIADGFEV